MYIVAGAATALTLFGLEVLTLVFGGLGRAPDDDRLLGLEEGVHRRDVRAPRKQGLFVTPTKSRPSALPTEWCTAPRSSSGPRGRPARRGISTCCAQIRTSLSKRSSDAVFAVTVSAFVFLRRFTCLFAPSRHLLFSSLAYRQFVPYHLFSCDQTGSYNSGIAP